MLLQKGYKDGSQVAEGCNVTLIGRGAGCRFLNNNQLATLPESFGDLKVGGDL